MRHIRRERERVVSALPQLTGDRPTITDGGLETVLIFREGVDLPHFAACDLLRSDLGRATLLSYYEQAAATAARAGLPFSIDTPSWRAYPDWTERLGYDDAEFEAVNRAAVALAREVRDARPGESIVVCGVVGPRGDGYSPDVRQTVDEARSYHARQLAIFAEEGVDYAAALTLNYVDEAIGLALAARDLDLPIALLFTVETDGKLASGDTLQQAIEAVDAATDGSVAYFGINCAHPTHLPAELFDGADWSRRVQAYRANASRQSHAELDEAEVLDDGDPAELGGEFGELVARLPQLRVLGGCCGTDDRHMQAIATAIAPR